MIHSTTTRRRTSHRLRRTAAVLAFGALALAACGGSGSDGGDTAAGTGGDTKPATTESSTGDTMSSEAGGDTMSSDTSDTMSSESGGDTMSGDSGTAAGGDMTLADVGEGEGELNLIAWAGYVEDGSTDAAVDWVTPFEEATGCEVNVQLGNSSDEMVQLMQTGEYDGVSASGDATLRLIRGGEVSPVDTDKIPNYADVFDDLKDQPHNSVDGQMYGVPHGRGANLLVYNTSLYETAPDSWSEVFETDSKAAGSVSIYDSPIYIADAALYLMTHQPDLGITNPYALDQTQFDAAIKLLEQQKTIAGQYWALYTDQQAALEGDTALAGTTWQVIVNLAQGNGAKIDAVKPTEGATGWSDTWMLSSKAKHPNCMYQWMNHIISPQANAQVAEWFGEAPANAKSCDLTSEAGFCETFHATDTAYWTDVYYWTTPEEDCLDGRTDVTCIGYPEWVNAWNTLRS